MDKDARLADRADFAKRQDQDSQDRYERNAQGHHRESTRFLEASCSREDVGYPRRQLFVSA
jgi:hypothetical protein